MTDITKNDVLAIAPELSAITDDAWVDILAYVNEFDSTGCPPEDSPQTVRMIRIFLAAHMGSRSLGGASGIVGPVTSESAGGLKRSYGFAASSNGMDDYSTTPYGMTLLSILMSSGNHGPILI